MRTFLDELAGSGAVARAAHAAGMSAQGAYNRRNRDPVFAAGWAAALHLARQRLADELLARSLHGTVEQIHRDGAIVGERHRYDNRLSLGLLHRLDRLAERDEAAGAAHPRLAAGWGACLRAIGEGRDADLRALLAEPARSVAEHQDRQVRPASSNDAEAEDEDGEENDFSPSDDHAGVWTEGSGADEEPWTDYPPPEDFAGDERGTYGDGDYSRTLTDAECAAWRAFVAAELAEDLAAAAAQRDAFFFGRTDAGDGDGREDSAEAP